MANLYVIFPLQVWLYEEDETTGDTNIYVHHDILLPAFPLCLAWMDCDPRGGEAPGNLVRVIRVSLV